MKLFEEHYDDESLWSVGKDIVDFLPDTRTYEEIPEYPDGFKRGTFKVTVEWIDDES